MLEEKFNLMKKRELIVVNILQNLEAKFEAVTSEKHQILCALEEVE